MIDKEGISWEFSVKSNQGLNELRKIDQGFDNLKKSANEAEGQVTDSFQKMDKQTSKFKQGLQNLAGEFPLLGNAIRLATSPLGLFTLGVVGVTAAFAHGVQEAKKFDNVFLELKQLNLDKTTSQINTLREDILDLSFEKGLDPHKTVKAFLDVQGGTGKFGDEVKEIVGQIGVFSMAMKMDFNEGINGAVKAMKIFGFGSEEMGDYLASSANAVNVGIASFEELAKVQTEFAGAAGAAGQDYDAANKVFAQFSLMAKNADIAATYTKGFFEDLTKLEKIKINVFKDDGSFRKMDDILSDVNDKFKKLTDQDINKLIEKVGGNEGLRGMLKQVQLQGDDVLKLFEDFDNADFDFDKALANAKGDLDTMSQIVDNKLTTAWIRLGDTIKPILIDLKSWLADTLDWFGEVSKTLHTWSKYGNLKDENNRAAYERDLGAESYMQANMPGYTRQLEGITDPTQKMQAIDNWIAGLQQDIIDTKGDVSLAYSDPTAFARQWNADNAYAAEQGWYTAPDLGTSRSADIELLQSQLNYSYERVGGTQMMINELKSLKEQYGAEGENILGTTTPGSSSSSTKDDSIKGVSVAGAAIRNVTVNIENLIRENIINSSSAQNGMQITADEIVQIVVRAVRDAELTLSRD